MKVQIIGLGIVGTAQAYLTSNMGSHEIIGKDPFIEKHEYCKVVNSYEDSDITFICTSELIVDGIIKELTKCKGLIVIKSTVPIGTTRYLSEKYNIHICHNPEFLREESHLKDVMNPNMTLIGECCKEHGDILEKFYTTTKKPVLRTNTNCSEACKLFLNAYLSVLITYWNEINELCEKLGIDTKIISGTLCNDPRISNYGRNFFGKAYGGKCLPKDINHLIENFKAQGLNPKLFEACEQYNEKLKNKNDKK